MTAGKGVLKICRKITGEHPCQSVISITLQSSFAAYIRTPFSKNTSGWLVLLLAINNKTKQAESISDLKRI